LVTLNDRIILQQRETSYGASGESTLLSEQKVWCKFEDISTKTAIDSISAGVTITHQVIVRKPSFKNYTHALINGDVYNIEATAFAGSPQYLKLLLTRG